MESFDKRRDWLWPASRLFGLLPMSLLQCQCAGQRRHLRPLQLFSVPPGPGAARWSRCWCPPLAPSLWWQLYSLSLMVLVLGWTAIKIVYKYADMSPLDKGVGAPLQAANLSSSAPDQSTNRFVSLFDMTSISVIAAVCVLQAATTQRLVLRLTAQLRRVDSLLSPRTYEVPRWLLVFLMSLTFVVMLDMIYKVCTDEKYAVQTTPSYLSYIITYLREAMFVDDVSGVRARFRAINAELSECLADLQSPAEVRARASDTSRKSRSIGRLATAYDLLCQCVESVARQYSLFLLCDMLGLLVRLVITTYFIVDMVLEFDTFSDAYVSADANQHLVKDSSMRSMFVLIQVLWLGGHFLRMLVLVSPCSSTIEETRRAGAIISSTVVGYDTLDDQVAMQLKALSVQLLHRKIAVSAFGVFDLSLPLVCTVMSAVTTYLVVLLQLKLPSATSL